MSGENKIALSVVVRVVGGQSFVRRCLDRLLPQIKGRPIEVIVPYDSTVSELDQLGPDYPEVIFVDMGVVETDAPSGSGAVTHELYDRRTARGLSEARGEILALLEDYGTPDPDWCDQILEAHRRSYGVVGGAVEQDGLGLLNWAVYFIDFGRYQLPLGEGPVDYLTDVNVSYKREALELVPELWAERYNEVTVHWALAKRRVVLWQQPRMVVRQDRGDLSFLDLLAERFWWGRLFGSVRAQEISYRSRLLYMVLSPTIPVALLSRMAGKVLGARRNRKRFLLAFPLIVALTVFWSLGELVGYVTGRDFSQKATPHRLNLVIS